MHFEITNSRGVFKTYVKISLWTVLFQLMTSFLEEEKNISELLIGLNKSNFFEIKLLTSDKGSEMSIDSILAPGDIRPNLVPRS